MTAWLPAALAAAATAVVVAAPRPARSRLARLQGSGRSAATPTLLLAGAAGWWLVGPAGAALAPAAVVVVRRTATRGARDAALKRERAGVVEALCVLAGDLRAGRSPEDALAAAAGVATGGTGEVLTAAAATAALGGDVAATLAAGDCTAAGALRGLGACWAVCTSAGSGLAAGVERLEEGLRAAESQRQAVDAELAGPRASAALLAVLPLGGLALAAALGAHPVHVLVGTPFGLACLVSGLMLDAAGVLWTRRLVASILPP